MAGDVGKELPKGRTSRVLDRKVGRRNILGGLAKIGAAATVVQWAGRQAYSDEQVAAREGDKVLDAVGNLFKDETKNQPGVQVEIDQKPDLVSAEFKTVYPNLTSEEKAQALEMVRKGKVVMLNNLTNEAIGRIAANEEVIRSSITRLGMSDGVANLLLGLVIAESNGMVDAIGDPDPQTGEQARGLTQMMKATAEKYALKISGGDDDERFIPEKILPATALELLEYYSKFGNWGLAIWSWHAGEPQVYEAVRVYLSEKFDKELLDINVVPANDSPEAQAEATAVALQRMDEYKRAIRDYNVTIFHLFSHPTIRTMFSGKGWNMTDEYVYRVIGAQEAYFEEKSKLGV